MQTYFNVEFEMTSVGNGKFLAEGVSIPGALDLHNDEAAKANSKCIFQIDESLAKRANEKVTAGKKAKFRTFLFVKAGEAAPEGLDVELITD